MKTLQKHFGLLVVAAGLFFATHSLAGGVCRAFTDTQGRTVKGQLMGFDEVRQLVTIQPADERIAARARLADFSHRDQRYIQQWVFEQDFNEALDIFTARKTERNPGTQLDGRQKDCIVSGVGYEIKLVNRSNTRFESVEIEYCLFYRQGSSRQGGTRFDDGVECGRFQIDAIMPDTDHCARTERILIFNASDAGGLFGRSAGARGEVLGLWLRVHTTSPYGTVITRDYCSPSTLNNTREWESNTIGAGLNHQDRGTAAPGIRLETPTLPSIGRFTVQ